MQHLVRQAIKGHPSTKQQKLFSCMLGPGESKQQMWMH